MQPMRQNLRVTGTKSGINTLCCDRSAGSAGAGPGQRIVRSSTAS
jgi:hypothetical protein